MQHDPETKMPTLEGMIWEVVPRPQLSDHAFRSLFPKLNPGSPARFRNSRITFSRGARARQHDPETTMPTLGGMIREVVLRPQLSDHTFRSLFPKLNPGSPARFPELPDHLLQGRERDAT